MKNKKKRHIRTYAALLLCATVSMLLFLDDFVDFFLGVFAGFHQVDAEYAKNHYGDVSRIAGGISVLLILVFGVWIFFQIRKKIAKPIEQLAEGMQEVSRGNLQVRVPVNGDFEFEQIQESFNYMVEELDRAKQNEELMQKRNRELFAGIAHDLKTPMTMVLGYARLLEADIPKAERKKYLDTIIEQTEHTNTLLDSLLAYSKLENISYQLKKETKDIAECLRACVADFYPVLEKAQIQMELLLPDKQVEFEFDEVEMKRVFMNLLSNMVKHNPEGTSCIVELEEKRNVHDNETVIRIVVADNGPKIAADLQERLFDTFAVGDSSRNTKNGSGLGLAISKKIVERHNGTLLYVNELKPNYKGFVIELC